MHRGCASRGASEGARGPSMVAANVHRGLRVRQAREGQEEGSAERRRRRNVGFEEEMGEEGRAVTGYGIPA